MELDASTGNDGHQFGLYVHTICMYTAPTLVLSAVVLLGALVLRLLCSWRKHRQVQRRLAEAKDRIRAERAEEDRALVRLRTRLGLPHRLPPHRAVSILGRTAPQIVEAVRAKELSATEVMQAVVERALECNNERLNCLTELPLVAALEAAHELDRRMASSDPALRGLPLLGLPLSLKDGVDMRGCSSSNGLVRTFVERGAFELTARDRRKCGNRFLFQPVEQDSVLVSVLREAGAIPFVKTNVPQTLISFECVNPVYGRTLHPTNSAFSPGGSSGGEACLIADNGSFLGVGTDIGGSVRIPASFCGVTALKTTDRRLSKMGLRASVPGQEAVPGVIGPIARDVSSLALLMQTALREGSPMFARDHSLVPLPFDAKEYTSSRKLRVGHFSRVEGHPSLDPVPGYERALLTVAEKLKAAGHHVEEWQPPRLFDALRYFYILISADGARTITQQLSEDVWEEFVAPLVRPARLPRFVKSPVIALLRALGMHDEADIFSCTGERTVTEVWKAQRDRAMYRQEFFSAWKAKEFDVVLCPPHMLPAVPHKTFKRVSFAVVYSSVFNLLDYPAGVVPVARVSRNDCFKRTAKGIFMKAVHAAYDPVQAEGLPLGVQVVGLPWQEETVLRAMREIESFQLFASSASGTQQQFE